MVAETQCWGCEWNVLMVKRGEQQIKTTMAGMQYKKNNWGNILTGLFVWSAQWLLCMTVKDVINVVQTQNSGCITQKTCWDDLKGKSLVLAWSNKDNHMPSFGLYCLHSQMSGYHCRVVVVVFSISVHRCYSFKLGHTIGSEYVHLYSNALSTA